tara:strand:- start:2348 stop:3589 length:1242 start_codon:yes stop_codon:yes gene_type:complete
MERKYSHKVEEKTTAELIPYINNSRTHSEQQVKQIASSIKEFGFTNPILIDEDNGVIAGHGRLQAAEILKLSTVPVIVLKNLTEAQKKAYVIADNQIALTAEWDLDKLRADIETLHELDFNVDLLGFEDEFLDKLLEPEPLEGLTDEDDVPDAPEKPKTKKGDIWILGKHRLMCGDSTSIDAVDKLMDGQKADMVFTDPPYNADYKSRGANEVLRKGIKNDSMSNNAFETFITEFLSVLYLCSKHGASYYICCNWKDSYPRFYRNLTESGVNVSSCIVWNKGSGGMGWQDYRYQYEFIIYAFNQEKAHSWYGGRTETDVWQINREARQKYIHPTQKPVELVERAIKNSSKSEDIVLDLFGGSGSTLIASQKMKRYARLMELDPVYCDVIVTRWQNFTGEKAINAETGKEFADG